MRKQVREEFKEYVVNLYDRIKDNDLLGFREKFIKLFIEDAFMKNGEFISPREIEFTIKGIEANFIRYPQIYLGVADFDIDDEYTQAWLLYETAKFVRKYDKIYKKYM